MVDINIPNFIGVGIMSVASYALIMWIIRYFNINVPWLA